MSSLADVPGGLVGYPRISNNCSQDDIWTVGYLRMSGSDIQWPRSPSPCIVYSNTDETVYLEVQMGKKTGEKNNQITTRSTAFAYDLRQPHSDILVARRHRAARLPRQWCRTRTDQLKKLRERIRVGCKGEWPCSKNAKSNSRREVERIAHLRATGTCETHPEKRPLCQFSHR